MNFYQCAHCGNLVLKLKDSGVPLVCCGQPMILMEPGTADASPEKHVPDIVYTNQVVQVQVGKTAHPMTPEHRIEWIVLETDRGYLIRMLNQPQPPAAFFKLAMHEHPLAVYAFCNLHGLWSASF